MASGAEVKTPLLTQKKQVHFYDLRGIVFL